MITALEELRTLRAQIKAANERIKLIAGAATQQAVNILAEQGKDRGEFTINGHKYQLQVTEGYDFGNYNKYKDPECIGWRANAKAKAELQDRTKALTRAMDAQLKMWVTTHPDRTPDTTELTVKCLD
jgi:hypothetical protein